MYTSPPHHARRLCWAPCSPAVASTANAEYSSRKRKQRHRRGGVTRETPEGHTSHVHTPITEREESSRRERRCDRRQHTTAAESMLVEHTSRDTAAESRERASSRLVDAAGDTTPQSLAIQVVLQDARRRPRPPPRLRRLLLHHLLGNRACRPHGPHDADLPWSQPEAHG